jgi:predicted acyl esterase
VLTLEMSSTASDGAIHAYLEDVAPTGRVTYLDEGIFRVIHRKEVDPKSLPYEPLGPAHSFLRADAEPMINGEVATIRFSLCPTSVLLRKGALDSNCSCGRGFKFVPEISRHWHTHLDRVSRDGAIIISGIAREESLGLASELVAKAGV